MRRYWFVLLLMAPLMAFNIFNIAPLLLAAIPLIQGLMSKKAQEEEERKKRIFDAQQKSFETQANAQQTGLDGRQRAYQSLMNAYQGALIK